MSRRLARSAGLIGVATLASRLLGLVRDVIFANLFGAGALMDAFNVATRMPTLLRDLFAEGAMSAAFVPRFTQCLEKEGRAAAWRLGSQVVNALLLITGVLVVLGIVFVDPLIGAYADKFRSIPGKLEVTVQLTRLTMPFLTLVAVAAAYMGMLNALRRFFVPSLSPALFNVVIILSAILLTPVCVRMGWSPILSLGIGTLLGGVAQIVVQVPALRSEGFRHQWVLDFRDPALRQVLMLMGPGTLGVAAAQINILVNTQLATGQNAAISWLNYAFRLMYMPIGIFGVSVATAAIPDLARQAGAKAFGEMRTTLSYGLRLMLMLGVPSSIGLIAIGGPIVELMFQHGRFVADDTAAVAAALAFYSAGIVGYSIVKIASPSFYAMGDARTPVICSVVTVLANLVMNLVLWRVMGYRGLALGTGIAANINAGLLLVLLSRRIGGIEGARVLRSFLKITAASIVMGLAAYGSEAWLHRVLPATLEMPALVSGLWSPELPSRLIRVIGAIGAAIAVLAASAAVLRIEEFGQARRRVLSRFKG